MSADPADMSESMREKPEGPRSFVLHGRKGTLAALGHVQTLDAGTPDMLGDRVRGFFAERGKRDAGAPPLVGALPFDPAGHYHLYQPARLVGIDELPAVSSGTLPAILSVRAEPTARGYADAVRKALAAIAAGGDEPDRLRKVVLARSLVVSAGAAIDPLALLRRLGTDPGATRFAVPLHADGDPSRYLVGATPELLVAKRGNAVRSFPLAGSIPIESPDGARLLMASDKDQREHALVVEAIADLLAPLCHILSVPAAPELRTTRTMRHLGTRIEGELADPEAMPAAALAALLHPTPAIGGTPRDKAVDLIRALEPVPRGFYAGAVGWSDARGDGDWYVALRCAEVEGARARLYAGAGIVAGSDPETELVETSAKFRAILDALGIDEGDGGATGRQA